MKTLILLTTVEWLEDEGLFCAKVSMPDAHKATGARRADISEAVKIATEGMLRHWSPHMKMASQSLQGIQSSTAHEPEPLPHLPTEHQL